MPTIPNPPDQQPPKPDRWPISSGRSGDPSLTHVREQLRLFLILLLGLVIVNQLALPFRLAGLILALGIGWVGIRLLIQMSALSRAGSPVRGWLSVIIGLGVAGALTVILAIQAAWYPVIFEHERCLSEANTLKAQAACDRTYRDRIEELTDNLGTPPNPR